MEANNTSLPSPMYWKRHSVPEESFFVPPRLAEYIEDLIVATIESKPRDYELCEFCIAFFQDRLEAEVAAHRDTIIPDPEKHKKDQTAVDMLQERERQLSAGPEDPLQYDKEMLRDSVPKPDRQASEDRGQSVDDSNRDSLRRREISWGSTGTTQRASSDQPMTIKKITSLSGSTFPENLAEDILDQQINQSFGSSSEKRSSWDRATEGSLSQPRAPSLKTGSFGAATAETAATRKSVPKSSRGSK